MRAISEAMVWMGILSLWAGVALASDRPALDAIAQRNFQEFHLFTDGDGMHLPPDFPVSSSLTPESMIRDRWGATIDNHRVIGLFTVRYRDMKVPVMGCVLCHAGKADGKLVIGLGNKTIDV